MKLFTGWVMSAGLIFTAAAANAQVLVPYEISGPSYAAVSDIEGPYAAMPPEAPPPPHGPTLLPPREVYTVVRGSGFSPRGKPQQRGPVYTIAVSGPGGGEGRLVIDARTGRILRFVPTYQMGAYGPVGPLSPFSHFTGGPRPPRPIPGVASRTPSVPTPKPAPPRADEVKPLADKPAPEPAPQSAAVPPKPADAQAATQAAAAPAVEAKPAAPQILPTQEMPKVQGLE
jgi:hypothetical protein